MSKLKQKFINFMYGRYGSDKLGFGLLVFYLILIFINMFVKTYIINILAAAVIVWSLFRMFSKNISKRRAENAFFVKILNGFTNFFKLSWNRLKDIGTHRYRKCPECKAVLRLPRKKGDHAVKCPKCSHRFNVKILF